MTFDEWFEAKLRAANRPLDEGDYKAVWNAAQAAEREECAKIADSVEAKAEAAPRGTDRDIMNALLAGFAYAIAGAIRARGGTPAGATSRPNA